jgi:hypothetical protein
MKNTGGSPQKGDLVRLKRGFDHSFEALAVRRAGLPLKEGALYEVIELQCRNPGVVLLREVSAFRIAGVQHVIDLGSAPFPYTADRFQGLRKSESGRRVVRIRARSRILRLFREFAQKRALGRPRIL